MALADSLISFWPLDEASGNAIDAHSTNDLTETGGTIGTGTGPDAGTARDCEADDTEYFEIADNADLSFGNEDFSFAIWYKPESEDAFGARGLLSKGWAVGDGNAEYSLYHEGSSDRFKFTVRSDAISTGTATADTLGAASTGTWYFLVAVHDSVNNLLKISGNGGAFDTTSFSTGCQDKSNAFRIGEAGSTSRYADGLFAYCGVWGRVLTSDEVTELYNSGAGRDYDYITGGGGGGTLGVGLTRSIALSRMRLVA